MSAVDVRLQMFTLVTDLPRRPGALLVFALLSRTFPWSLLVSRAAPIPFAEILRTHYFGLGLKVPIEFQAPNTAMPRRITKHSTNHVRLPSQSTLRGLIEEVPPTLEHSHK